MTIRSGRCMAGWYVSTALILVLASPASSGEPDTNRGAFPRGQASVDRLLGLALRSGVSAELESLLREKLRTRSEETESELPRVEAMLEEEALRLMANDGSDRALKTVELLRLALGLPEVPGHRGDEAAKLMTGSIQGRVTDALSGVPLDFEFVEVYNALGDFVDLDLTNDGDFSIEGLADGTYFVLTDTEDHLDELFGNIPCPLGVCDVTSGTPVQVTQGAATNGVDFALARGGRILGSVRDAASGLPLRFEFVEVFNALGDRVALDLTDGDGGHLLGGLPTGIYFALADADNHVDELFDGISCPLSACNPTSGTQIMVTLGNDTLNIDFDLEAGGRVAGTLTERQSDLPLDFEFVDLYDALGNFVATELTGNNGSYLIGGLPAGTYFARTDTFGDFLDELYDDIPCLEDSCVPTSGTPISVNGTDITPGIDFELTVDGDGSVPRLTDRAGLIVPIFIDLTAPDARTTHFAIHNSADMTKTVQIGYHTAAIGDEAVRTDQIVLAPNATTTVNVRADLTGYETANRDTLTGIALVTEQGSTTASSLTGDSFSVDLRNDFASGDKLIRAQELCNRQRIRFVDFGSGTELRVLLNEPRGTQIPSFSYTAFDQTGAIVGSGDFFADEHLVFIDRADLASQPFGVLDLDFGNAVGGSITANYSAFGRFSVGLAGECLQ